MLYSQRRHSGFFSSTLYGIFPCHSGLWIPCAPTKHNNKKEEHMTNKPSSAMHSNRKKTCNQKCTKHGCPDSEAKTEPRFGQSVCRHHVLNTQNIKEKSTQLREQPQSCTLTQG